MFPPPTTHRPSAAIPRAFTLIELLVSMSVLTLLVLFVGQMVSGTTSLATNNRQHLDADGQARLVFDRMALDLGRMVKRQDVDYIFASLPGNDKFFFYSEAPAYFDGGSVAAAQSPLGLVGYRIDPSNPRSPTLSRLGKGLTWDESATSGPSAIVFLTPSSTPSLSATPAPIAASTLAGHWPIILGTAAGNYDDGADATSYHPLAEQVCRMEICFLLKPTATQSAIYSVTPYRGGPGHDNVNGLQDVRAVVVALAVLDSTSRQIAPDLSRLATALPDITASNLNPSAPVLMAKLWQDEIDQQKLAQDAGIPQAAAAQMRVYQRHFYLDTN